MSNRPSVRVAVAQFEDIVSHGLRALITEDDSLDLVADGVPHDDLKSALSTHVPDVAILNFGSLSRTTARPHAHAGRCSRLWRPPAAPRALRLATCCTRSTSHPAACTCC